MPQSDGREELKRIAIHFSDDNGNFHNNVITEIYRFAVNPENYKHDMPQRSTVVKTKSNIIVEDFGKDIETITFSGTLGFRRINVNGRMMTGKERMDELRDRIDYYANSSGGSGNRPMQMRFMNNTDNVHRLVHIAPQGLSITRDANEPLLFRYEITLQVLGFTWEDGDNAKVDPEIGNVNPSYKGNTQDRLDNQNSSQKNERDKNEQVVSDSNNMIDDLVNRGDNKRPDNAGKKTYNPRFSPNGLTGVVGSVALQIGYGNGGVT